MIPLPLISTGKVREIYQVPSKPDLLLFVASDRLSAFDVILASKVKDKGIILTQLSVFWFNFLGVKSHYVSHKYEDMPEEVKSIWDQVNGRAMLIKKFKVLPIEAIVRGYLAGSAWIEYKNSGKVCDIVLESNLLECSKLSEPIFTPTTKAPVGQHDENISFEKMVDLLGNKSLAEKVKDLAIEIYKKSLNFALSKGIIIADTKFEFGIDETTNEVYLIDEVLTPDSSRFWSLSSYQEGKSQDSFDKQIVRDFLLSINFNKKDSIELPAEILEKTRKKYFEIYEIITGSPLVTP